MGSKSLEISEALDSHFFPTGSLLPKDPRKGSTYKSRPRQKRPSNNNSSWPNMLWETRILQNSSL